MSAPNLYGSNKTKSTIVMPIDANGVPWGPDNPLPVDVNVPTEGLATAALQTAGNANIGATDETPAAADNSTSGLNGLIKRLLQRITVIFVAQGSTTAAQIGPIVQGATTTTAPTYVTAKTNPLSLKENGDLRVNDAALGLAADTSATTDAGTFTLISLFKRLLERLTTALGAIGTLTTNALSVRSQGGYKGTFTVTRAANQTPYTANDVVGGALTIATVGPTSGDILIMSLKLMLNITALPAAMTSFRLYLYNATPPSAIADNSPFTAGTSDTAVMVGYIDNIVPTLIGTGTSAVQAQIDAILKQVRMPAGTSLFAYLVTNGAFTPAANSETYDGVLNSQQV